MTDREELTNKIARLEKEMEYYEKQAHLAETIFFLFVGIVLGIAIGIGIS